MKHETKAQTELVLQHLKKRKSITPLEALNLYGIFRLSARIYDLKCAGLNIVTTLVKTGRRKRVGRYSLVRS